MYTSIHNSLFQLSTVRWIDNVDSVGIVENYCERQFQQFSTTCSAGLSDWCSQRMSQHIEDLGMKRGFNNEKQQVLAWKQTPRLLCSWPCGVSFLIPDLFRRYFCDIHFGWSIKITWKWFGTESLQLKRCHVNCLGMFWGKGYLKTTHISPRYHIFFGWGMGYLMPWKLTTFICRGYHIYAVLVGSFNPGVDRFWSSRVCVPM